MIPGRDPSLCRPLPGHSRRRTQPIFESRIAPTHGTGLPAPAILAVGLVLLAAVVIGATAFGRPATGEDASPPAITVDATTGADRHCGPTRGRDADAAGGNGKDKEKDKGNGKGKGNGNGKGKRERRD